MSAKANEIQSAAKHTPGPWTTNPVDGETWVYDTIGDALIARVVVDNKPGQLNAKLIAAAPDMTEALLRLLTAFGDCVGHAAMKEFEEGNTAVILARAALAKAGL